MDAAKQEQKPCIEHTVPSYSPPPLRMYRSLFLFPFPGTLKRKTGILYDRSRHYPSPSSDFNQKRFAMKQNTKENYLTH
jgi:hypothetical protein